MPLEADATYDAARLLAQAERLEVRVRALRCEASDLSIEAAELRTLAENMTRAPVTVTTRATPDVFLARVVRVLDGAGALGMSDLTEHLNASATRVRAALARLEEDGRIVKSGIKRGTRYELSGAGAGADDTPDNVREFQSYEALVRDVAVRLDTFDIVDVQRELPNLSEATVRRWVRRLEDRGVIASERVGTAKVYAYVPPPDNAPASRPRKETPESEAARTATPDPFPRRRGAVVAGTRNARTASPIVNALIREVRGLAGDEVKIKRTAHKVVFMLEGVEIASCSSTPGASSLKSSRAQLRKAGVPVGA